MLLIEFESDTPLELLQACMIPKPFSYTSFTSESPLSTYAIGGSHFLLTDCMRYSKVEDAVCGRMTVCGLYAFLGLVNKNTLVIKLKNVPEDRVVHFLLTDGTSYSCTVPVSLTSRLYSSGSVVSQLIRENSWKADMHTCRVPVGQSLCVSRYMPPSKRSKYVVKENVKEEVSEEVSEDV